MKTVITCAGSETRWSNHMGVPKQMAPMFGVPLLQRTVQAMNKAFPDSEVYVSVQNQLKKESYIVDGKYQFYVLPQFNEFDSALKSLVPFFKEIDDDFCVLMGDVTFSKNCIDRINEVLNRERSRTSRDLIVFGRKFESRVTSRRWGELFAFYIPRQAKSKLIEATEIADHYYSLKLIPRKIGWDVISCYYAKNKTLREIQKLRDWKQFPASSFITIDDETDDFDFPNEYDVYLNEINKMNFWRMTLKSLQRWVKIQRARILDVMIVTYHRLGLDFGVPAAVNDRQSSLGRE